jgi:hypothetical protein
MVENIIWQNRAVENAAGLGLGPYASKNTRRAAHTQETIERAKAEGGCERDQEGCESDADALDHGEVSFLIVVNVSMGGV